MTLYENIADIAENLRGNEATLFMRKFRIFEGAISYRNELPSYLPKNYNDLSDSDRFKAFSEACGSAQWPKFTVKTAESSSIDESVGIKYESGIERVTDANEFAQVMGIIDKSQSEYENQIKNL